MPKLTRESGDAPLRPRDRWGCVRRASEIELALRSRGWRRPQLIGHGRPSEARRTARRRRPHRCACVVWARRVGRLRPANARRQICCLRLPALSVNWCGVRRWQPQARRRRRQPPFHVKPSLWALRCSSSVRRQERGAEPGLAARALPRTNTVAKSCPQLRCSRCCRTALRTSSGIAFNRVPGTTLSRRSRRIEVDTPQPGGARGPDGP